MADTSERAPQPAWMLEEIDHAGRENLDAAHVERYDTKEAWDVTLEVELLARLGLDGTSNIVDMGAGTGQLTMAVAPRCRRVVAVDISPLMLDRLRAKAAAAGATNVECVHAGFLSYAHQGAPADVVFSRWALHHLPDLWKVIALDRMRAVLRPGGILRLLDIAFSFDPADAADAIERWCSTLPVEAATEGAWVRADIEEHVRDEHSTFTWLLEPMIERSGFTIEEAVRSPDGIFAEYVARAT